MPLYCSEASTRLSKLQSLKQSFEVVYTTAKTTNSLTDWNKAKSQKQELDLLMHELETDLGLNYEGQEKELKQLFGENFLGIHEIETAFTDQEGNKLVSFTKDQQEEASRLLHEKFNEPDMAQFITRLHEKKDGLDPKDFMLVLRVNRFADDTPITMQTLHTTMEPIMKEQGQGKLLFDTGEYQDKSFFTEPDPDLETKGGMEWVFVTKKVISETLDKTNAEQTPILTQEEQRLALTTHLRSKAWEVVYDFAVMLRTNNIRLFTYPPRYDRTSDVFSDGRPVCVGLGSADGLGVFGWDGALPRIGSRLSR